MSVFVKMTVSRKNFASATVIPIDYLYVFESGMEFVIVTRSVTVLPTMFDSKLGTGTGYWTVTVTGIEFAISIAFGSSSDSGSASGM